MTKSRPTEAELLQGTLDMLILKVVASRPIHGYAIVQHIQQISKEALRRALTQTAAVDPVQMLAVDHLAERFARPLARQNARESLVKIPAATEA